MKDSDTAIFINGSGNIGMTNVLSVILVPFFFLYRNMRVIRAADNVHNHQVSKLTAAYESRIVDQSNERAKKNKATNAMERMVEDLILEAMAKGDWDNLKGSFTDSHLLHVVSVIYDLCIRRWKTTSGQNRVQSVPRLCLTQGQ